MLRTTSSRTTLLIGMLALGAPCLPAADDAAGPRMAHEVPDPGIERRITDLLSQLTLDEKLDLLSGTGYETRPVERLGIPALKMVDGPAGVRQGQATAFPAPIALAATWNPELAESVGRAVARETKAKGGNVLLAPCVNIHRTPFGGRNFESFGEDPYLAGRLAVAYVRGVQGERVIATVKHFACNNQEHERLNINVEVDERALNEIYLPAFKAAVTEAGVWGVMSAYNKLNGAFASENGPLLTGLLKERWGFRGFVLSDWGAVHSVAPTVNAGLDLEMPTGKYLSRANLARALDAGEIRWPALDDKVRRILRAMLSLGIGQGSDEGALDTPEHRELAKRVALESMVLLKNDGGLLPLDPKRLRSVAVIGPNAAVARVGGGGSAAVTPFYSVSPLDGLKAKLEKKAKVNYAPGVLGESDFTPAPSEWLRPPADSNDGEGLLGEYFANADLIGEPMARRIDRRIVLEGAASLPAGIGSQRFSVRWSGELRPGQNGRYLVSNVSDDGSRVYLDGKLLLDNWGTHGPSFRSTTVELKGGQSYPIRIEYVQSGGGFLFRLGLAKIKMEPLLEAVETAKRSDVAVVCVGLSAVDESEGSDRKALGLPEEQERLIAAIADANPRTIVVLNAGAAVLPGEWLNRVPALLLAWYPGQEGGNALAELLLGETSPSGKLPTSFVQRWEDASAYGNYPGQGGVVRYDEGIFVGYRHLDKTRVAALFPFGHGLSYTGFAYGDLRVAPRKLARGSTIDVSFAVTNTGARAGAEIAQLYVRDLRASAPRPVKELKAFSKVFLKPGETQTVRFTIDESALAFFHPDSKDWQAESGAFELLIGGSANDIWLRAGVTLE
jgi:beta-glucosidase